jgi:hypothetical protein
MTASPAQTIPTGTHVEVFSQFTEAWISGFEIATTGSEGYHLRRLSDNTVLPVVFSGDDLRREHAHR